MADSSPTPAPLLAPSPMARRLPARARARGDKRIPPMKGLFRRLLRGSARRLQDWIIAASKHTPWRLTRIGFWQRYPATVHEDPAPSVWVWVSPTGAVIEMHGEL